MTELVSLDECAFYNDTNKINLQKLRHKDKLINRDDRFIDDKVVLNYLNPLEFELSDLYYKALFACGSEGELAKEIAKILKLKSASVYAYLYRFNFKHYKKAHALRRALNEIINTSIWSVVNDDGTREFVVEF